MNLSFFRYLGIVNKVLFSIMEVLNNICLDIVDCEHKTAPIQNEGIPSIRTTDIKNGFLDFKGSNKVSEETYQKWTQRLEPRAYDIILAREAPVGQVGIVPKGQRVCLGQRTVLIRPNKQKVYPFYLLYLLLSREIQHKMKVRASGSTVEHLNMSDIRNLQLPDLPSLKIQKEIGDTLGNLDAKIENLRRQNETLEAIAQTLFKHWFIDFEFPNADGKPYKSSGGAMIPSELGKIPEGWRVEKLGDLTQTITKGTTPTTFKKDFVDSGINFIKAESISESHTLVKSKFAYIDEETNIMLKRSIVQEKDILYTIAGTIGRYAMVTSSSLPANTNQAVALIRPDFKKIDPEYLLCYFASITYKHYLSSRIVQAVQANLSLGVLSDSPITIPEQRIKNLFSNVVVPIFSKKESHQMQIETLTKTRDTLLPKLMSGQLRVKE
ncbi:restriction endonuclease subunit S [Nostoc sp. UHCC 0870]|uniref:restriction endonuclease subunit S n=1 Tax=Nostoc sp. UHCC 0870 TaxID=2914041 RepID=UPI001EDE6936|nr:restriction endonuclease subunit S [Nostoc sp. UHCC 0870]UKP01475.1 restriction endonuclease subunit S [Nostoc sp. UHCC 0870]